jgi:hypothetical protein
MKRYSIDGGIPTLAVALSEHMTAGELRKLASLTGGPVPTRKAERAEVIARHLAGPGLRTAWDSLDELQKAAVAEVVHARGTQFRRTGSRPGTAVGRVGARSTSTAATSAPPRCASSSTAARGAGASCPTT